MKIIAFLLSLIVSQVVLAQNKASHYEIPLKDINDKDASLKAYKGKVLKRFESQVKPDAPEVVEAIEAALATK